MGIEGDKKSVAADSDRIIRRDWLLRGELQHAKSCEVGQLLELRKQPHLRLEDDLAEPEVLIMLDTGPRRFKSTAPIDSFSIRAQMAIVDHRL